MKKKLTLHVDNQVAERAKEYARKHKFSISGIVEKYLDYVTKEDVIESPPKDRWLKSFLVY